MEEIRENFISVLSLYKTNAKIPKPISVPTYNTKPKQYINKGKSDNTTSDNNNKIINKKATLHTFKTNTFEPKCKFCSDAHASKLCEVYPKHESRIQRCNQLNLCTRCTGTHKTEECKRRLKFPCKNCKGEHLISMCQIEFNSNKTKNNSDKKDVQSGNIIVNDITNNVSSLLPTITIKINTKEGPYTTRAYIDSCSQQTFVNRSLLQNLNLPITSEGKTVTLSPFIGTASEVSEDYTNLNITLGTENYNIKAMVIDQQASKPINVPGLSERTQELKNKYTLADKEINGDVIDNIDMLIGVDNLDLVMRGIIKINNGIGIETPEGISLLGDINKYRDI